VRKVVISTGEVILVTPVAVTGGIRVVTEQINISSYALLVEALLSGIDELFQNPLPCLVVSHKVIERVTFRSCVLRMGTNIKVEPSTICKKHI
jgi:hypothetical protein